MHQYGHILSTTRHTIPPLSEYAWKLVLARSQGQMIECICGAAQVSGRPQVGLVRSEPSLDPTTLTP